MHVQLRDSVRTNVHMVREWVWATRAGANRQCAFHQDGYPLQGRTGSAEYLEKTQRIRNPAEKRPNPELNCGFGASLEESVAGEERNSHRQRMKMTTPRNRCVYGFILACHAGGRWRRRELLEAWGQYSVEHSFWCGTDASCLTWEGQQYHGKAAIVEKLSLLPFQKIQHSITSQDHQPTPDSCIISMVVGQLKADDDPIMGFHQVFLLKNIQDAWVCTNDMFRLALHNFG
ncbi:hypothetical protein XELAEV_18024680mg [Xenopus laevis]|uniref:NTF2 domain-containing protein n=1 Tax=Xenopus laevis TaxID=8355 RepID=A0A974CZA7_XENLA|nr:hypothetical protein XELAEV_18024680mg [Xenopus laevis]